MRISEFSKNKGVILRLSYGYFAVIHRRDHDVTPFFGRYKAYLHKNSKIFANSDYFLYLCAFNVMRARATTTTITITTTITTIIITTATTATITAIQSTT